MNKKHIFLSRAVLLLCSHVSLLAMKPMELTWENWVNTGKSTYDDINRYGKIKKNIRLHKGTNTVSFSPQKQDLIATLLKWDDNII
ncbi:MAG: hypothetical protein ABH827_00025 [bacterium]